VVASCSSRIPVDSHAHAESSTDAVERDLAWYRNDIEDRLGLRTGSRSATTTATMTTTTTVVAIKRRGGFAGADRTGLAELSTAPRSVNASRELSASRRSHARVGRRAGAERELRLPDGSTTRRGGVPEARLVIEPERLHEIHHGLLGGCAI
jgi:hypothetical protein